MSHKNKFTFDDPEDSYWNESDSATSSLFDDIQSKQFKARAAVDNLFGHEDVTTPTTVPPTKNYSPKKQNVDVQLSSASPHVAGKLVDEYICQKMTSKHMFMEEKASAPSVVSEASASSLPSEAQQLDMDYSRLKAEHRALKQQLENIKHDRFRSLDVDSVVKRLLRGDPVSLEFYKSYFDKKKLLLTAVECHDKTVILRCIIFLKNTTSKKLFREFMKLSPEATSVYIDFLHSSDSSDLENFLRDQGRYEDASMLGYKIAQSEASDNKVLKLHTFLTDATTDLDDALDLERLVAEEAKLIELQRTIDKLDASRTVREAGVQPLVGSSAHATLYHCCLHHYDDNMMSVANPTNVQKRMDLEDHHVHHVSIRALAKMGRWPDIERLVIPSVSKNNLSPKGIISSVISSRMTSTFKTELLCRTLSFDNVEAPKDLLCRLLRKETDRQERLRLALKYDVPEMVIECLVANGERSTLSTYAMKLPANSPEAFKAMTALTKRQMEKLSCNYNF